MARSPIPKARQKEIAQERIKILFEQAAHIFPENKILANRYVALARKIAMKLRMRLPRTYKRKFCKHCYKYLQPGVNARIRTQSGKVVISCLECGGLMRIPLGKKIKKKTA